MKFTNFTSSVLQSAAPEQSKVRKLPLSFDLIMDWKIKRLFLSAFFVLYALQFSNALDLNRKADSTALFTLYTNAGGSGWVNKSGWLTSYITSWYGVTTSEINGSVRVTG